MVVIVETGDGGWDTQEEPRDMLVGRVFGGLPNARLGRHSVKAARSPVDPGTEPSTPCSPFPDLGNMNKWETPRVPQREG
ncbi:hypothetical protein Esi_0033_0145 [Ectocarpus siliculosus]|uniref:Uncharacterized protein n=1 Tax=Ectocarpus siliculosus TaxID=2880 RepID=D7FXP2_ECTSI|nr:hypothetical protein Esi_0033_0145 [Ectocarpus siliculosus]|eukprot:CBJ26483.1 hypothetical protein Esi_0033_0145 [Ectocarpus siliculosus]